MNELLIYSLIVVVVSNVDKVGRVLYHLGTVYSITEDVSTMCYL